MQKDKKIVSFALYCALAIACTQTGVIFCNDDGKSEAEHKASSVHDHIRAENSPDRKRSASDVEKTALEALTCEEFSKNRDRKMYLGHVVNDLIANANHKLELYEKQVFAIAKETLKEILHVSYTDGDTTSKSDSPQMTLQASLVEHHKLKQAGEDLAKSYFSTNISQFISLFERKFIEKLGNLNKEGENWKDAISEEAPRATPLRKSIKVLAKDLLLLYQEKFETAQKNTFSKTWDASFFKLVGFGITSYIIYKFGWKLGTHIEVFYKNIFTPKILAKIRR